MPTADELREQNQRLNDDFRARVRERREERSTRLRLPWEHEEEAQDDADEE